jgi:tetratricopeptide (TPR) repeat protein
MTAFDQALVDFTQSIALVPDNPDAYLGRSTTYLKSGRAALALPDADQIIALHPQLTYGFELRGSIFEALGRREDAIADYHRSLAMYPNGLPAKNALHRLGVADVEAPSERNRPQSQGDDAGQAVKKLMNQVKQIEKLQ